MRRGRWRHLAMRTGRRHGAAGARSGRCHMAAMTMHRGRRRAHMVATWCGRRCHGGRAGMSKVHIYRDGGFRLGAADRCGSQGKDESEYGFSVHDKNCFWLFDGSGTLLPPSPRKRAKRNICFKNHIYFQFLILNIPHRKKKKSVRLCRAMPIFRIPKVLFSAR